MDDGLWKILTPICVVAAVALVATKTKGHSPASRVLFSLLAAMAVGGALGVARPLVGKMLFSTSDDYAWSAVRQAISKQYPEVAELFALNPEIEGGVRSAVLPLIRKHDLNDPALVDAVSAASVPLYAKLVFPVAIFGSDEAMNEWGAPTLQLLLAVSSISQEACGDYALTGVNRYSPNARIDAGIRATQRSVIQAYKSSDKIKNPLPSQRTIEDAYAKAVKLAQPPFSQSELASMDGIEKLPKVQVCNLMIRLFGAIEKLDPKSKAVVYRSIMKDRL